jgi:hypothetical protein
MTGLTRRSFAAALVACIALSGGCGSRGGDAGTKTAKIVFLDRLDGNADAKARLDSAWVEVQTAIEDWPGIRVERIHVDAEPRQSSKFLAMRSVDTLPGLYFLDEDGKLIEMVQGRDVTMAMIREILNRN